VGVPAELHSLFWDCRPEEIDAEAHASLVLERILEYGSLAAVRWAVSTYGTERLRTFLVRRGVRTLSRKTLRFWVLQLGLEGEPCFERSSLTRSRPFWNY
jgi:hypothetical protein